MDPARPLPEIRPNLAETFDLTAQIDGFDATIVHLPAPLGWLAQSRIDLCPLAFVAVGLAYTLGCLLVVATAPPLSPLLLLVGLLVAHGAESVVDDLGSLGRRLGEGLARRLRRRSSLRLGASRLVLGGRSWPLEDVAGLSSRGAVLSLSLRGGAEITLRTNHSPWACAKLSALVNAQLDWHRSGRQLPPPALVRLLERVSGS